MLRKKLSRKTTFFCTVLQAICSSTHSGCECLAGVVGVDAAGVVHEAAVVVVAVHHGRAPPPERRTLLGVPVVDPDEVIPGGGIIEG